ncbi:hypothetical protein RJ639_032414 [Escallonia herrerae]|uniref:DNA repair protein UVH3 n=1 Tax=Escallonia herrerae TaxID=1293975 RepID=A0AA88WT89_9ASTE|nr:hypothetical protein RJ639_032414 [Escallonia herrerae]
MGVHNLWELLAPVGRRVSVETLAGKKLAIDASIWMIQFMKAMRDEKGEMVRNAHVLGFFRRICKLLFLRTKPVFVFDGGTPALKRRTVVARRRQRENAQAKIRKTAEKLLLNHLKELRLKELAKDLEGQRQKNDVKGKRVMSDTTDMAGNPMEGNKAVFGSYNQEQLDEMFLVMSRLRLAASLAEEDENFAGGASASGARIPAEEEDGDEDEEMILPTMHGKVDPAVLAALPPSMQLDLLVQMRERLMAENRQKYQKVKKAPARFSELQIQAYLKTVAFRREIDEVRKSAAGRGIGGVQTSRIASEANREFIFSSSFTGDKQVLTSAGLDRNSNEQRQIPTERPSDSLDGVVSNKKSNAARELIVDEPSSVLDDDIDTYLDERGRVRVSRVRAMGFRLTRDLQRNLDLMKEAEQDRTETNQDANLDSIQHVETSHEDNNLTVCLNNTHEESTSTNKTAMEVSFEYDSAHKCVESDDDLFADLVAEGPAKVCSTDNTPSRKQSVDSTSDCEWEEGLEDKEIALVAEGKDRTLTHDIELGSKPCGANCDVSDESEVDWEDGSSIVPEHGGRCPPEYQKAVSKGALEEECEFQEAIRRSIEEVRVQNNSVSSSEDGKYQKDEEVVREDLILEEKDRAERKSLLEDLQSSETSSDIMAGGERKDGAGGMHILKTGSSPETQLAQSVAINPDNRQQPVDKPCQVYPSFHPEHLRQDGSRSNLHEEFGHMESVAPTEGNGNNLSKEQRMDASSGGLVPSSTNICPGSTWEYSETVLADMPDAPPGDTRQIESDFAATEKLNEITTPRESLVIECHDSQNFAEEVDHADFGRNDVIDNSAVMCGSKEQFDITEASLEEEMLDLDKERADLGDEQRKLERDAESVSSEMFAECQELLQMFGLPYIIAPMEAEAQCAYMELANLVDGVVTDDSDVFLFGARSVYKNIFDDRKYVETYFMKDIENELGLTREKLIRMALLLGSDYTEGVSGIGIVNAIEVVNAFPEEDGLQKFREWIESPDPSIFGKVDGQGGGSSRKKGSKAGDSDVNCLKSDFEGVSASEQDVTQSLDGIQKMKEIFMTKHRNVSKNWHIPSSFPSEAVVSAYDSPQVDKSTEPFAWGKPDLFVLRRRKDLTLCWEKFGWGTQKADELLLPVLKEYNKHETQLRLEAFYTFNERFAKIRSKRIKKAVKGIAGNKSSELMDDSVQDVSESKKKRKVNPNEAWKGQSDKVLRKMQVGDAGDEINAAEKRAAKHLRKRKTKGELTENVDPLIQGVGRRNISKGLSVGRRGTERGRGRDRGRAVGRGRWTENFALGYAEASSDDENHGDSEPEVLVQKKEGSFEVRRSTRPRRMVKYVLNDLGTDESDEMEHDDGDSAHEEAGEEEAFGNDEGIIRVGLAGPSKWNNHEVGDNLLKEGLSVDHLDMEGGFCMDEAEPERRPGHEGTGQNCEPLSDEYLEMGGGFCLDEDGAGKDSGQCASSSARTIFFDSAEIPHCSGSVKECEGDISASRLTSSPAKTLNELQGGGQCSTTNDEILTSQHNIADDESGIKTVRSLSAIPYLRRKRRKS